jgi:hypothetical protein
MNMTKQTLLAVAMIAAMTSAAQAQRITLGASVTGIASQGEFHEQIDRAFGINGFASYKLDQKGNVAMRFDAGWLNHGWEMRSVNQAELTTTNDIFFAQVGPEFSMKAGNAQPYLGASIGVAYFVTDATTQRYESDFDYTTMMEHHDAVLAYSARAGVRIPVISSKNISLDLGTTYQRSDEASFLRKGSVVVEDDGSFSAQLTRGKADFWGFNVGVSLPLQKNK